MNRDNHLISEAYKLVVEQTPGPMPGYKPAGPAGFGVFRSDVSKAPQLPGLYAGPDGKEINFNADVLFDFDSATIKPEGLKILQGIANKINQVAPQITTPTKLEIHGHTDLYELKPGVNQALSKSRADAVGNALKQMGVTLDVVPVAHGSSKPVVKELPYPIQGNQAPETGKQQQAPNRRVSLTFNPPLPAPTQKLIIQDIPRPPAQIQGPPQKPGHSYAITGSFPPEDVYVYKIVDKFKKEQPDKGRKYLRTPSTPFNRNNEPGQAVPGEPRVLTANSVMSTMFNVLRYGPQSTGSGFKEQGLDTPAKVFNAHDKILRELERIDPEAVKSAKISSHYDSYMNTYAAQVANYRKEAQIPGKSPVDSKP